MVKASPDVARGINALGRAKTYKRRALWAIKKKNGGKFPQHPKKQVPEASATKAPRFYPADDVLKPLNRNVVRKPTKLRDSITPGTVLILLSGRFKGKRVVFLKQLPSGLLLVTGPFKLNGVPLRRVNQAYVIATSTKISLPALSLDKFEDSYFKDSSSKKKTSSEEETFFKADAAGKKEIAAEVVENQKAVDAALLGALSADLKGYLSKRFSLKDGDRPHLMKF